MVTETGEKWRLVSVKDWPIATQRAQKNPQGDSHGFGGHGGKEPSCEDESRQLRNQCKRRKRCRFDPWVGKTPWRRKWQPTPGFLPEKSFGQRSLKGYSPKSHKESDTTE